MNDYTPVYGDDLENVPTNHSSNPTISEIMEQALARRKFLKSGAGAAALAFMGVPALLRPETAEAAVGVASSVSLGFTSVPQQGIDQVVVPAGYNAKVLYAWGDPIGAPGQPAGQPAWRGDATETAAEQELQSGAHHDGMHFFPFPASGPGSTQGYSNERGLLVMNHEYADQGLLFPDGNKNWSLEKVRKSQAAHGVSVVEVRRTANGGWRVVRPSSYARRITVNTPMDVRGPARTSIGITATGTLNNCAHGYTPWGTYLTCEENINGYFGAKTTDAVTGLPVTDASFDSRRSASELRYGFSSVGFGYNWHLYDPRFDLNTTDGRLEQRRYGWVVEIDPYNPNSKPVKRTALGRIKHEGAVYSFTADGRVAIYMGDDQANDYIYKFVTAGKYVKGNRPANRNLLDTGTLYVARFDAGAATGDNLGTGQWLPLTLDNPAIAARFATLGDMLVDTRIAADIAGATKMDRPEWLAVNPKKAGEIYCTLTNNSSRTVADEANPRASNRYGSIIRWNEAGGDPASTTFEWDYFALAGDPVLNAGTPNAGDVNGDSYACPDGLWFDYTGRLWIQTDISSGSLGLTTYANFNTNMMLAADPVTGETKRFLTGPKGCEVTGVVTTPDGKTMFVNIQHPGETAADSSNPDDPLYPNSVSFWPGNQGYGFTPGVDPQNKLRPRSGTVVITREDGGVIGE